MWNRVVRVNFIIIAILATIFCSASCTVKPQKSDDYIVPSCVTQSMKGFILEWGYDNASSESIFGYQLDENGYILLYNQARASNIKQYDTVCRVSPAQVCAAIKIYHEAMLKIPVVNEPGDQLTYIIFQKPAIKFYASAKWNKYNTFASTDYRSLFDTLMSYITVK